MTVNRIHSISELAGISASLKKEGKTVAYCHGEFDLLHFGHLRHFKEAAQQADVLIVTVTPDKYINKGPGRPVYNESYRAEFVSSLECVAYAGINEWPTAENSLNAIRPTVYCKGNEYVKKKDVTGRISIEKNLVESLGGRLHFTEDVVFSSSELSKEFFSVFSKETLEYLKGFCGKNDVQNIIRQLEGLSKINVLISGASRLVVEPALYSGNGVEYLCQQKTFAAGAIPVANQLAQLCASVHLKGELDDSMQLFLDERVEKTHEGKYDVAIFLDEGSPFGRVRATINQENAETTFLLSTGIQEATVNQLFFDKDGKTHIRLNEQTLTIPAFSGKRNPSYLSDDLAFAVAACGLAAGWKLEVIGFVAAATLAMAQKNEKEKEPVEGMSLSKYLIALMK